MSQYNGLFDFLGILYIPLQDEKKCYNNKKIHPSDIAFEKIKIKWINFEYSGRANKEELVNSEILPILQPILLHYLNEEKILSLIENAKIYLKK